MTVKFRILNKELDQHSVVVRYYTDYLSEDDLATSITVDDNGNNIIQRGEDGKPLRCQTDYNINIWNVQATQQGANSNVLVEYISRSAPFDWFELKYAVMNTQIDTNMALVDSLIGVEYQAEKPVFVPSVISENKELTESEIEALINSMVSNLVSSNTTSSS
jgi:hypothetical protein